SPKSHSDAVLNAPQHGMGFQLVEVVTSIGHWEGKQFVVDGTSLAKGEHWRKHANQYVRKNESAYLQTLWRTRAGHTRGYSQARAEGGRNSRSGPRRWLEPGGQQNSGGKN